jgi:hypothetical protein
VYEGSPLNRQRGEFAAPAARPGAAAPDGRLGAGYFVEGLQGEFSVACFGGRAEVPGIRTVTIERESPLWDRYGVPGEGATYVFRPDGHVLARCAGIDGAFAREAIQAVLDYRERA